MKLPTTFTKLDLAGFDIDRESHQISAGVNREMVDVACAILQRNRVGIIVRSLGAALKEIYGISGNNAILCKLLKEWRADNLANIKARMEKDLPSALLEIADDGLLDVSEIPADYLKAMQDMAIAGYRMAYQDADTAVSGDRMKNLTAENEVLRHQVKEFPQIKMELEFYKERYNILNEQLRDALLSLDKQKLAEADTVRVQLEQLRGDRSELEIQLELTRQELQELQESKLALSQKAGEISRLNGQIASFDREISSLHSINSQLQAQVGEKQVLEAKVSELQQQLKTANESIVNLQTMQKSTFALSVDRDEDDADRESSYEELLEENNQLSTDLNSVGFENDNLKEKIAKLEAQLREFQVSASLSKGLETAPKNNEKTAKTNKTVRDLPVESK